jgi:hypothetical protein
MAGCNADVVHNAIEGMALSKIGKSGGRSPAVTQVD